MRWVRPLVALALGLSALGLFWGVRFAYADFLPMRGYQEIHGHVIAPQEGLFLALYIVLGSLAVGGLAAAGFLAPVRSPVAALERWFGRLGDRWFMVGLALFAAAISLMIGQVVLEGGFLTDDEMAMLFQARLLLEGRLWAEPTPFQDVFHYAMMIESPRWYGIYPIGQPAVIALSLLLTGEPRLLIALVAAGWVVLTFLLARRLFDRTTAAASAAMLCLSPFFALSSGTMASEMTSGFFLLAAVLLAVGLEGRRELIRAAVLGLVLGAAFLVRPYTALVVGTPLGLWVLWRWFRRHLSLASPALVLLCAAPFLGLYLWSNAEMTGSPWLTPYEVNFPTDFRLGFGQDVFGVIHTPQLALAVAGLVLLQLNAWVLGWPLSLAPVVGAVALGRLRGAALLLLVIPLFALVAFMPVPMAGVQDTGPLYYLEVLPLLVILAGRGLVLIGRRLGRERGVSWSSGPRRRRWWSRRWSSPGSRSRCCRSCRSSTASPTRLPNEPSRGERWCSSTRSRPRPRRAGCWESDRRAPTCPIGSSFATWSATPARPRRCAGPRAARAGSSAATIAAATSPWSHYRSRNLDHRGGTRSVPGQPLERISRRPRVLLKAST